MFLSGEQTRAAMHGLSREVTWAMAVRPVGPQPIPEWCAGIRIDWMDAYSNSPDVRLKARGDLREWPDKRFEKDGAYYRAYSGDGRMEQYAHDGPVTMTEIKMWKNPDGSLHHEAQWDRKGKLLPGEWVPTQRMATTIKGGFGGARIPLQMVDGSEIVLRGPWHTGAPAGYTEVAYVDVSEPDTYRRRAPFNHWYNRVARGGLYLTDDLFVSILARFAAHLEIAEITYNGVRTVEPMKPEWDAPKFIVYERERQVREALRKAAA